MGRYILFFFFEGWLSDALRSTMSMPGLFSPVKVGEGGGSWMLMNGGCPITYLYWGCMLFSFCHAVFRNT